MQIIPVRVHGILDYVVGALLIIAPYLLSFASGGMEQWVVQVIGVATIIVSLLTRYDFGAVKVIPFKAHLGLDVAQGVLLLVSPWLFGFSDVIWWPHLLFGLIYIVVPLISDRGAQVSHIHI